MKGQAYDPQEIRGAIKAVQAEIADCRTCDVPCREAGLWREVAIRSVWCAENLAGMLQGQATQNRELAQKNAHMEDSVRRSQKAVKELNARANGIHIVPASEPKETREPRRRGRPPGQPATINKRPEHTDRTETVDLERCPHCRGHELSEKVTDEYERAATIWHVTSETVLYTVRRRYCRTCKKQVSAPIPGVNRYARTSSNVSAAGTTLNMPGLSHGKAVGFISDISNGTVSRSWSYRNKASTARRLEPAYDGIRRTILDEPYLQCDEFVWPVPGEESKPKNGYAPVARGTESCLVGVSKDRAIDTLEEFLPEYEGVVGQDSYPGWLHIGKLRQMCIIHQKRLPKKDPKYNNPQGDVRTFLERLSRLCSRYMEADAIRDPHTRRVAAICLDRMMGDLMHGDWQDDGDRTINRYRKRWRREGLFMSTFLHVDGIDSTTAWRELTGGSYPYAATAAETGLRRGCASTAYCSPYAPPAGYRKRAFTDSSYDVWPAVRPARNLNGKKQPHRRGILRTAFGAEQAASETKTLSKGGTLTNSDPKYCAGRKSGAFNWPRLPVPQCAAGCPACRTPIWRGPRTKGRPAGDGSRAAAPAGPYPGGRTVSPRPRVRPGDLKCHTVAVLGLQIILESGITPGNIHDTAMLPPMLAGMRRQHLSPGLPVFHADWGYDSNHNCQVPFGMGIIPNIKQRGGAVSRGKPYRSRAAKTFNEEYRQRGMMEGVFGGGESTRHRLHCRFIPPDNRRRFGKIRAIAWNIKALNRLRCARMRGVGIPSYGTASCV